MPVQQIYFIWRPLSNRLTWVQVASTEWSMELMGLLRRVHRIGRSADSGCCTLTVINCYAPYDNDALDVACCFVNLHPGYCASGRCLGTNSYATVSKSVFPYQSCYRGRETETCCRPRCFTLVRFRLRLLFYYCWQNCCVRLELPQPSLSSVVCVWKSRAAPSHRIPLIHSISALAPSRMNYVFRR
jgi:hypothetical protein